MNMFKANKATSVEEYLASVPRERKESMLFLHEYIQKSAPNLKAHFAYNMLGYGSFAYKNYKKEIMDWPIVALANQKKYISLYICAIENGEYIAEKYKKELGKVSVGKSCIRFKKLGDLHMTTLKNIIQKAAKFPGLIKTDKIQTK